MPAQCGAELFFVTVGVSVFIRPGITFHPSRVKSLGNFWKDFVLSSTLTEHLSLYFCPVDLRVSQLV